MITFHFAFLNKHVTVSPSTFKVIVVPPRKLVGVITTLFVPDVDTLINVLICPSVPPSANEIATVADVALISVIPDVTFATCDEASAVIACEDLVPNLKKKACY